MSYPPRFPRHVQIALGLSVVLILAASPAALADLLVTRDGQTIETNGPWIVNGKTLTYIDADGARHTLQVSEVDLEASEKKTALEQGRPYVPKANRASQPAAHQTKGATAEEDSKITLYMTSWCGYCRKADKLLKSLDADFVAKDIEKDAKAAREYRSKAGGRSGVPLLDIDGSVVRGYNERAIRQLVAKLKQ
ncbi:MAG: glutaredoxin domain-containing protein, partial [Acidobacteriota bacterium]